MWRLILARAWLLVRIGLVFLATGLTLGAVAPASATSSKYAAIVIDANSGRVLYSRNADSYRYPASLTKMMTLYLTFAALERKDLSLDDALPISRHAQAQAPSKLGLKAGNTISVKDCILALVTKSANDAAVVLSEKLGGTETKFTQLMTKKAHALGMKHTTFRNASGLPNSEQRTTARDLAMLAQALMTDFPQYYGYFSTAKFTWHGRTFDNHDHLLEDYPGTTGLKTGYTAASGFNLATAVQRHGYNLIGIVMGGRTAKSRDGHMMQLLDMQFARLKGSPMLASRQPLTARLPTSTLAQPASKTPDTTTSDLTVAASGAPLDITPVSTETTVASLGEDQTGDIELPRQRPGESRATSTAAPRGRPAVMAATFSPNGDPIGDAIAALSDSATPTPRPRNLQVASLDAPAGEGDTDSDAENARVIDWLGHNQHWGIQIGAFAAMESAAARLSAAAALAPDQLKSATPAIISTMNDGAEIFQARFGPFEEQQARNACNTLASRGITCVPVKDRLDTVR